MHLPATAWGVGWYIAGDCKKFGKHCCRVFVSILVDINVKILLCYSITAYNGAHLSPFLSHSCTWGSNPDREAWLKNIMWPIKLILHTNTHVYIYTHTQFSRTLRVSVQQIFAEWWNSWWKCDINRCVCGRRTAWTTRYSLDLSHSADWSKEFILLTFIEKIKKLVFSFVKFGEWERICET